MAFNRFPARIVLALSALASSAALMAQTPDTPSDDTYLVGLAQIDITPSYPVMLRGFGGRTTPATDVLHPVYAKALAINTPGRDPALLLTIDILLLHQAFVDDVVQRLHARTNLPRDRIAFTVTHSHTTSALKDASPTLYDLPRPPEYEALVERYTNDLADRLVRVALQALNNRSPARLAWTVGSVDLAHNRRTPNGPVDHDLPLLTIRNLDGKLRGLYLSYACHCTTLSGNKISGDWAGYAQSSLQKDHPDAVALLSIGCAGDSNPTPSSQGDNASVAARQGRLIADEVNRLLNTNLKPVTGPLDVQYNVIQLPLAEIPSRDEWEKRAQATDHAGFFARVQLARLQAGQSLDSAVAYPIQSCTFGDSLAIVFLSGEVVVDYSLRLKAELDRDRLWINAYSNAVRTNCYIPSERVLREGGYEAGDAMVSVHDWPARFRPGLEQRIVNEVRRQIAPAFAKKPSPRNTR